MATLPSIENLQCFDAAARLLNFRAASRSVGLTPAAFGQRIKQLEDQLGSRLFDRTTRSVRLTEAGLALVPTARQVIADARECLSVVSGDRPTAAIEVTLGTRFELGMSWVVPNLGRIAKAQPHVLFQLYFGSGNDLLRRLRSLEVDCAITSSRITDSRLDSEVLHEERYVFVGATKLLERNPITSAAHTANHVLLDIEPGMPLFRYAKDAPGFPERVQFGSYRWLGAGGAIKQLVLAGEGVAVLPLYMVEAELRRGRLRKIFSRLKLLRDSFRLVFSRNDGRRVIYEELAGTLRSIPIV